MIPTMELKTNSNSLFRCKSLALSSEVAIIKVILQILEEQASGIADGHIIQIMYMYMHLRNRKRVPCFY